MWPPPRQLLLALAGSPVKALVAQDENREFDDGANALVRDRTRAGKSAGRRLADPRRVDLRPYSDVRRLRRRYDRLVGAVADPRLADGTVGVRAGLSVVEYRLDGRRPRRRSHRRPHWA